MNLWVKVEVFQHRHQSVSGVKYLLPAVMDKKNGSFILIKPICNNYCLLKSTPFTAFFFSFTESFPNGVLPSKMQINQETGKKLVWQKNSGDHM